MLIIRFSRVGKRNHAQYRVVLAEKSFPIKGKFVEILGSYNPHSKEVNLREDRIKYWLEKGTSCSDSVFNFLIEKGIIKDKKRLVSIKKKAKKAEEAGGEGKKDGEKKEADDVKTEGKDQKEEAASAEEKTEETKEEKAEETGDKKKEAKEVGEEKPEPEKK